MFYIFCVKKPINLIESELKWNEKEIETWGI